MTVRHVQYKQSQFFFSFMVFALKVTVLYKFPKQWAKTNYRAHMLHSFCQYFFAQLLVKKQMESTKATGSHNLKIDLCKLVSDPPFAFPKGNYKNSELK